MTALYGISPEGAVLVRPDGHVPWRASQMEPDLTSSLESALRHILDLSLR